MARWRSRPLRRALHHQRRQRLSTRLPSRIPPDPHPRGIGKMIAYAATGAIMPIGPGARLGPKSEEKRRCSALQIPIGTASTLSRAGSRLPHQYLPVLPSEMLFDEKPIVTSIGPACVRRSGCGQKNAGKNVTSQSCRFVFVQHVSYRRARRARRL